MTVITKLRRTHLGVRYDIFIGPNYYATADNARQWALLLTKAEDRAVSRT